MRNLSNKEWYEKLERYVGGGSSTGSKKAVLLPEEPAVIQRGKGCRVWDADGKEYIDFRNGLGPVTLGYGYPELNQAIMEQMEYGFVYGHPTGLEAEVAELFSKVVPSAEKVRFLKTGGEACSAAIRLARAYTGKDHIIQIGYNGWLNSLASGARVNPREVSKGAPLGVPQQISDLYHAVRWADEEAIKNLFANYKGQVAAVIIAADYANMEEGKNFYPFLREITRENGALLIYDEIVTGFRIAMGGVQEYFGVLPDLSVFAKGIANGMPLSVFCGRADVMDMLTKGATVSSTYGGEALSLAACKKVIEIYQRENICRYLWDAGGMLWSQVNDLFDKYHIPVKVKGFWPCPTFVPQEDAPDNINSSFFRLAYKHGVSLYNVSYVNFSHKGEDIAETVRRLEGAVSELASVL
ncbi:MAG: aspartate aminotransferase family protein [Caldicoprobacterales bacterium]|jgi:glutamate-1-semialdehyde 2,1-aminomutase|nr:aminotransferase class III-fold pyridoxal phosphate-dependent enzyme [Clostridiales bacterium]